MDDKILNLTVVIPCLNEQNTIGICVNKCIEVFNNLNIDAGVLFVDNCSCDDTLIIAEQSGARVVLCKNRGYGSAIRCGFDNSNGKYILIGDADNTYDFLEIPLFWNMRSSDIDIITGTRIKGQIDKVAIPFLHRYVGNSIQTSILKIFYGLNIFDLQCGMRLIKKECLNKINFKTACMELASELFVEFIKQGYKIVEIPISLYKNISGQKPHLTTLREGLRHLIYLVSAKFVE